MNSNTNNKFLVMWDNLGLECLFNLTEDNKKKMLSVLKEEKFASTIPSLDVLLIRARANVQRHYEIYVFESEIDEDYLREILENDPMLVVPSIREKGHKILDMRENKQHVRIY